MLNRLFKFVFAVFMSILAKTYIHAEYPVDKEKPTEQSIGNPKGNWNKRRRPF